MIGYELPEPYRREIDQYDEAVRAFRSGELNPVKFRGIRVPFGVYEQRKEDTYMVRVRCAAGIITPEQLAAAAHLADHYGNGSLHLTTRQGIQIHDVRLEDTAAIIRGLADAGLSTRGTGGNTVRNIIASPDAGVNLYEPFDVTPYAAALTSALIAEPDSWTLPRKYKIAFSNTADDTGEATAADLGFIAATHDGQEGFKVYIAGGLGRQARTGRLLYDFVPAEKIYAVAAGLKRFFNTYGNRKNKHAARLRFLWEKMGERRFREILEREIRAVEQESAVSLTVGADAGRVSVNPKLPVEHIAGPEFDAWKRRYVRKQKQAGFFTIKVPFLMGDVRSEDAFCLAVFLGNFGEDMLRCGLDQNLHIRNIPEEYLGNVCNVIREILSLSLEPEVIANLSACTGAGACKLGITMPKGALAAVRSALLRSGLDLDALGGVKINISGCPNSCGRHQTADLGFFGKAARNDGRLYPSYAVLAGGLARDRKARLGEPMGSVSAHDLPKFVANVLGAYLERREEYPSFSSFVYNGCADHDGATMIKDLAAEYGAAPAFEENRNYYFDWGADEPFSLDGRGEGECSAGMMDMIDHDAKLIKKSKEKIGTVEDGEVVEEALYQIALASSRMLLVTKGMEPKGDQEVFDAFAAHFIDPGLIPASFRDVVEFVKHRNGTPLAAQRERILALSDAVFDLYGRMDDSLNFTGKLFEIGGNRKGEPEAATAVAAAVKADRFRDYRGVACPINFVKVKLDLMGMHAGERIEVWLDDGDPISNVPRSVESEGHEVVSQRRIDNYWSVVIRRA